MIDRALGQTRDERTANLKRIGPVLAPYGLAIVLFFVGGLLINEFTTVQSARSLLVLSAFLGIASIGQTFVLLLGGIDLSIPALIGLGDVVTTQLLGHGMPFGLVMVIILGISICVGLFNAIASQRLNAHPLIVTLATQSIVLGGVLIATQNETGGTIPPWLTQFVSPIGTSFGLEIPPVVVLWGVLALVMVFLQRRTVFGRRLYASGSNLMAAKLALVRPSAVWAGAYALSGFCAGMTGVLLAGFSGGADPSVGEPYLFTTVAAVVVGGTSLIGGRGGYGRTVAGALVITVLSTLLLGLGADQQIQQMLLGFLIVLLVGIYGRQAHVRTEV